MGVYRFLETQPNPAGDWESWPGDYNSGSDEGHFYMECSNRGLCDRKTGQCECFPGFTGQACRRQKCPDGCSGHGTCQTVNDSIRGTSTTYKLWDGDMSRFCKCDAGFTGPSCAERLCTTGDDPLTKNQKDEVQYVDVYSNGDTGSGVYLN